MIRGSCLCGEVRFELEGELSGIGMCHCSLCRKVSGAAAAATIAVPAERFRWLAGEALVRAYARPSGYANSFCSRCGSPLPDPDRRRTQYGVPPGLLDGDPGVGVAYHSYVGSKARWDAIGDGAPQYKEDEGWPPR